MATRQLSKRRACLSTPPAMHAPRPQSGIRKCTVPVSLVLVRDAPECYCDTILAIPHLCFYSFFFFILQVSDVHSSLEGNPIIHVSKTAFDTLPEIFLMLVRA